MNPTRSEAADHTRGRLIEAAFAEIHRNGFRGASLDAILRETGVTKGALYYHFKSKAELGHAVVDEVVKPFIASHWQEVAAADNVIDGAIGLLHGRMAERIEEMLQLGCPFNNLVQEMSAVDEGFRTRLHAILEDWRAGCAQSIRVGQQRGHVRADVDPRAAAAFLVAAIEGAIGMAKATRSIDFYTEAMRGLEAYFHSLRATPAGEPSHG